MKTDPEKQRRFALDVVRRLRAAGHQAVWAGGCVRDQVLGFEPKDYDIATDAKPPQIREIFGQRRTLAIGAAFGVITVLGSRGAGQIEVATFRSDDSYSDGRRPDSVSFTSAQHDAQRRDFTINGLFYDPVDEKIIDYVGGREDLSAGIVRAIGDPRARFTEDKLRMLRAVRFTATFGFKLDDATHTAVRELSQEIVVVSPERIAAEMRRMLIHRGRVRAVSLLLETGLLDVVLPEAAAIARVEHRPDPGEPEGLVNAWHLTLQILGELREPTFPLALAALLHLAPDAGAADAVAVRWRLTNREIQRAAWLARHCGVLGEAETMPWPVLQRLLIQDGTLELLALEESRAAAGACSREPLAFCRRMLALPPGQLNPPPLISGDDLIAHGVPSGKIYGELLRQVRDAQLERRIATRDEALQWVDRLLEEML